MKHLSKGSRLIVFVMMLSVLTGCIALFDGGKVPNTRLTKTGAEDQTKPILFYGFNFYGDYRLREEFLDELHKSQYFKEITNVNSAEADIELHVMLTVTPNPKFDIESMGYLSGMTIGMIPLWSTEKYEIKAQVNNKTGLEKEYVVNDSITYVAWWPMLLLFPFTYNKEEDVPLNMFRNIIQQMYEDGYMGEI